MNTSNLILWPYKNAKKTMLHGYDDLQIVNHIGKGWVGQVFLAKTHDGKVVVIKMSKVIPRMLKPITGESWREIYFCSFVAPKYKKQLHLYTIDFKITDKCDFEHPMNENHDFFRFLKVNDRKFHQALHRSSYCIMNIMPYFPSSTLRKYYEELWNFTMQKRNTGWLTRDEVSHKSFYFNKRMMYMWFIDILKQVNLLHSIGFSHRDIHSGNILILKNCSATLIDYGRVGSRDWGDFDSHSDIEHLFWITYCNNHLLENKRMNLIHGDDKFPIDHKYYLKCRSKFIKTPQFDDIVKLCSNVPIKYKYDIAFEIAEMQMSCNMKTLMHSEYADQMNWSHLWLIDFDDVIYFVKHAFAHNALTDIIKHFKKRLNLIKN